MIIGVGKQREDLYYLVALASISPSKHPFASHLIVSSDLWHRHLGHPSHARLQYITNESLHFHFDSNSKCEICPLAKQTRQPFPSSSISTPRYFSLLHCDIWGRHKTLTQ